MCVCVVIIFSYSTNFTCTKELSEEASPSTENKIPWRILHIKMRTSSKFTFNPNMGVSVIHKISPVYNKNVSAQFFPSDLLARATSNSLILGSIARGSSITPAATIALSNTCSATKRANVGSVLRS